jgi:hypothetical protein
MALQLQQQSLAGVLQFEVTGEATLTDIITLIGDIAKQTLISGDRRVMVNLLSVSEVLKFTDHYSVGEEVARKLSHLERLASVVPAERRTQTSEKVANAKGMRLRVFTTVPDAMAWLTDVKFQ